MKTRAHKTMSASPLLRGASRALRRAAIPVRSSWSNSSLSKGGSIASATRRCVSTLNAESQQKVRQEEPDNFVASTSESSLANQPAAQQLLATNLKEADPAMYEIIENASCLGNSVSLGRAYGFDGVRS